MLIGDVSKKCEMSCLFKQKEGIRCKQKKEMLNKRCQGNKLITTYKFVLGGDKTSFSNTSVRLKGCFKLTKTIFWLIEENFNKKAL